MFGTLKKIAPVFLAATLSTSIAAAGDLDADALTAVAELDPERWDHVEDVDHCHALAMDELELQDCVRMYWKSDLMAVYELFRYVMAQNRRGNLDKEQLLRLLQFDARQLEDHLPDVIREVEDMAALVRARYPTWILDAYRANERFLREARLQGIQALVDDAERQRHVVRVTSHNLARFCLALLSVHCEEVEFGDAYPPHPAIDRLESAS